MVKRYRTVGARLEEKKYFDYIAAVHKHGSNPNEDLTKRIDEVLKENEPRETGTVRETSATNERPTPTVDRASEEKPNNRTITVNGKTYTY